MKKNDAKNAPIVFKNGVKIAVVHKDITVQIVALAKLEKDQN